MSLLAKVYEAGLKESGYVGIAVINCLIPSVMLSTAGKWLDEHFREVLSIKGLKIVCKF